MYILGPYTFSEAESECVRRGGHLASLHSVAETDEVYALVKQEDSWLGLTKASGSWAWTDGSSFGSEVLKRPGSAQLWKTGHGEDNMCGRWGWPGQKVWDDVSCSEKKPATCKVSAKGAVLCCSATALT